MVLQLTIDCADPQLLVPFWCEALGYVVEPPPENFPSWNDYWRHIGVPDDELPTDTDASDSIIDPKGIGPRVWFQVVPEAKTTKNRVHLDLMIGGRRAVPLPQRRERIEAEAKRLEALGARRLRVNSVDGLDHYGVVMLDPEGNEFCVGSLGRRGVATQPSGRSRSPGLVSTPKRCDVRKRTTNVLIRTNAIGLSS